MATLRGFVADLCEFCIVWVGDIMTPVEELLFDC